MTLPNLTIVGNLSDDPELKFTPSGAAVANFTVVVNERIKDGDDWKDGDPQYYRCAAWRQLAENVAESLQKGQQVIVTGQQKIRQYDRQDGSKGTSVELTVAEIGPSLRFATAKVTRAQRSGGQPQPQQQPNGWGQSQPQQQAADPWSTQAASTEPPF